MKVMRGLWICLFSNGIDDDANLLQDGFVYYVDNSVPAESIEFVDDDGVEL